MKYLLGTLPLADDVSVVMVLATFIPADVKDDPIVEVTDLARCFKLAIAEAELAAEAR